ncbi:hypothetical protein BXZ70DRAFT_918821 [Cristinia sonorae]|uniref:MYND-type domain-containing protein n=1 Tax=Cristinia sonorae TaxID=1940300 RepID=A0A8K0UYP3_9AGAR|nr:hypothetical protein BXZ70DRAFT_918821 [Cristinia sonorae]
MELLKTAESRGRENLMTILSSNCFEDGSKEVGQFWYIIQTRPYMRILHNMARISVEGKAYDKAVETVIEMLRLCEADNIGIREWLASLLIRVGRFEDALSFAQVWIDPRRPDIVPRGGCHFKPPSSQPLTAVKMSHMPSPWLRACFLYDAALAAFKLWGDCKLARQYLLLAAKQNPIILVKIMAKTAQQKTLNNSSRAMNSPEDASDYLWLAQDLWMDPEVWTWAQSQRDVKMLLVKKCSRKGCSNVEEDVAQFKRCGACHQVWYCGRDCQKADWKEHKQPCDEHIRYKATMKSITDGTPMPKGMEPFMGRGDQPGIVFNHTPTSRA